MINYDDYADDGDHDDDDHDRDDDDYLAVCLTVKCARWKGFKLRITNL